MTIYAIGTVNGNFDLLNRLLRHIEFNQEQDQLWFSGNLVNGGPDSLAVLRFVRELGRHAVIVLGHQEMRLLAIAEGVIEMQANDTFTDILAAEDRDGLLKWLYQRPLLHHDAGYTLVHAGIPAEWSLSQARTFAIEAEASLAMGNHKTFFDNTMDGTQTRWHAKLRGWKRMGFIINALTRMSYCDANGRFDFSIQEATSEEGYYPWSQQPDRTMAGHSVICSNAVAAIKEPAPNIFPLQMDTSGTQLNALCLTGPPQLVSVTTD